MKKPVRALGLLTLTQVFCAAQAAPLDTFLTARPESLTRGANIEASLDFANKSVDIFGLRPENGKSTSGDYKGGHLRFSAPLGARLWMDGALWQRQLEYTSVTAELHSWQIGLQHQTLRLGDDGPALALRLGAWGNKAPELRRTTTTRLQEFTFTSARATNARDRQLQFDVIGSWPLSSRLEIGGFTGLGHSQLDFDKVSATARRYGCNYNVEFTDTHIIATCPDGRVSRVSAPKSNYGIDVEKEAAYSATYLHGGFNALWQNEHWRLRAGYQYIVLDRREVDDIVERRGGRTYKENHILTTEIGYRLHRGLSTFVRAQLMANQFVGEIPLTYNSMTSTQHRRSYGFMSWGLSYDF